MNSADVSILRNAGNGTFVNVGRPKVGTKPWSICAADFTGDGRLDIATANYASNDVSFVRNLGSGIFSTAWHYAVGSGPKGVVAADFDGDGRPDLASANSGSNSVTILMNIGGVFSNGSDYGAGQGPEAVCVANFDADGKLDLAVANYGSDNVSIIRGIGDGTFSEAVDYAVGSQSTALCAADFDGDRKPDVATANTSSGSISIAINNGSGYVGVLIQAFTARRSGALVELKWSVLSDERIEGYRIHRAEEASGERVLLNGDLIPATEHAYIDRTTRPGRTYLYTLGTITSGGEEVLSGTVSVTMSPQPVILLQNHPNPFNPSTMVPFYLPARMDVEITIYSIDGRLVKRLLQGSMPEGYREIAWDGTDEAGRPASSGLYLYRLRTEKFIQAKKMILLR